MDIIEGLDKAIDIIEATPEINIIGVRDVLIRNVLSVGVPADTLYDVLGYVVEIDQAILDNRVNSFDNRIGVLSRLKEIRYYSIS